MDDNGLVEHIRRFGGLAHRAEPNEREYRHHECSDIERLCDEPDSRRDLHRHDKR
jgi:hypothetical protein